MSVSTSPRLNRLLSFLESDPGNLALRKDAAREACEANEWRVAKELVEAGLQAHPVDRELLAISGLILLHARRYADAEVALLAALEQGLDAPPLHYNLAYALYMQKRFTEAYARLDSQVLIFELPLAHTLRAHCLHHLGRGPEAIAECQARLVHSPDDAENHGLLALLLYEEGQLELGKIHAEKAVGIYPEQMEALLALASIRADSGEYEAARQSFHLLLKSYPQCGRAWLGLALLKLSHQQLKAAKRDIKFAATYMPEHIGTWHVLGWIEIILGDIVAAEEAFQKALAIDRNFGETHGGLAVIAAMRGQEEDAHQHAKRALRLNEHCLSARYAQLLLLQRAGRTSEAQALVDRILAIRVPRGDLSYRDLIAQQLKRLEFARDTTPTAYH